METAQAETVAGEQKAAASFRSRAEEKVAAR
jgi:hypothetical protein